MGLGGARQGDRRGLLRTLPWVVAAAALGSCTDPRPVPPAWRVLLVTVQGSEEDPGEGPALLAAWCRNQDAGTVFEEVWCATGSVRANGATLLAGGGPWLHGITDDLSDRTALPASLPSRAHAASAWTAAIVGVPTLARPAGVEEGFERFDGETGLTAGTVLDRAVPWLEARGAEAAGWLLWLHLVEPSAAELDRARALAEDPRWSQHTLLAMVALDAEARSPAWTSTAWVHRPATRPQRCEEPVLLADLTPLLMEHLGREDAEDRAPWVGSLEGRSPGHALLGLPAHATPPVLRALDGPLALWGNWALRPGGEPWALEEADPLDADARAALVDALRKDAERTPETAAGTSR